MVAAMRAAWEPPRHKKAGTTSRFARRGFCAILGMNVPYDSTGGFHHGLRAALGSDRLSHSDGGRIYRSDYCATLGWDSALACRFEDVKEGSSGRINGRVPYKTTAERLLRRRLAVCF